MSDTPRPVKKKAVSGSIEPRWPKARVVRWLEIGAVPAIVGLWWPDWLGGYGQGTLPYLPPLVPAFPPLLTYLGALILLIACYQGVKGMGAHFRGVVVSGALSLLSAIISIAAQVAGLSTVALLFTGLAAVFATGFLWFTIGKVAEITQESRTSITWTAIAIMTAITALIYLGGVYLFAIDHDGALGVLRAGVASLTLTFALCRYGVHCYKTQTSIGAGFRSEPDRQYWATVNR